MSAAQASPLYRKRTVNISIVSKFVTILGAFLIIFSSMILTIDIYGYSIPFYDEWDAEAYATYVPFLNGQYEFFHLFEPHNGHRIVFTRLSSLILFQLNGGWDPELQMILSAFLHALTGALMVYVVVQEKVKYIDLISLCAIVLVFSIPFSWMSVLVAFQTQFYFMMLFAIVSIIALSNSMYFLGYLFAFCSYLSLTLGAFVLPAFVTGIVVCAINSRSFERKEILHVVFAGAIFFAMILLRSEALADDVYKAQSFVSLSISTIAALWWPFRLSNPLGMLVFLPFLIYLCRSLFYGRPKLLYIVLGAFVLFQIFAMGYFRGADGVPPANRYLTILSFGICANLLCLIEIFKLRSGNVKVLLGLAWLLVVGFGILFAAKLSITVGLPERHAQNITSQAVLSEYLSNTNSSVFEGFDDLEISYNNTERLTEILSDPVVISFLPSTLVPTNVDKLGFFKRILFEFNLLLGSLGVLALALGLYLSFGQVPKQLVIWKFKF